MQYRVRKAAAGDAAAIMQVFNHYVENSFAAYPDKKVPEDYFASLQEPGDYPVMVVETLECSVVGFGMMKQHHRAAAFSRTAEIGYFILPDHTGKGAGRALLARLEQEARTKGIAVLLANISSFNEGSLKFHTRNGFTECGRFRRIGVKFGREFDVVWMQKML